MTTDDDDVSDETLGGGRFRRFASLTGAGLGLSSAVLGRKLFSAVTFASKDKREAALSRTLEKEGRQLAELLGRMKGASMKLGQMLSADPDLVPPELSNALTTLQTESPPMAWPVVREVLTRAWGCAPESVLASVDEAPRGSASIGQVHRATLRDGRAVAIKVQYPGVEAALASDVKNLRSLMRLSRVFFDKARVEGWLSEVEAQLLGEVDYIAEAESLEGFAALFERFPDFAVPRALPELTRRNVLVMTWLEGEKLDVAARRLPLEARTAIAERMAATWIALFFQHRWLHGDPHPGNFLLLADETEGSPAGLRSPAEGSPAGLRSAAEGSPAGLRSPAEGSPAGLRSPAEGSPAGLRSLRIGVLDFGATKRLPPTLTDGVMDLFAHLWAGDDHGALALMARLGFGEERAAEKVEPSLLGDYLRLVLAPFLSRGGFDYGAWKPHAAIKRMTLRHPSLWKLAPPKDLLPVLRVASGLKGLFAKLGVELDVRAMLERARASRAAAPADPWRAGARPPTA